MPYQEWNLLEQYIGSINHPHQWYGGRTYAQHGDDLAILNIFGCLRIEKPSYLDIGAHHPFELSNTALLYSRGSRGINVEANAELIPNFLKLRPEDINVCAAVVGTPRPASVWLNRVTKTSGINSLLPVESKMDAVEVTATTAQEIVDKFAKGIWPDLLSLDAEGVDVDILRTVQFKEQGPKVLCVEAVSRSGNVSGELRGLLNDKGYSVHSWCGGNMLFVKTDIIDWCR